MNSATVKIQRYLRGASTALVILGVALLVAKIFLGDKFNIALPLVFLLLAALFFILVTALSPRWQWAVALFIPAMMFLALGLIFFLNVVTSDWNAWAYAWLLVVACMGLGTAIAGRVGNWRKEIVQGGVGTSIVGMALFMIFGVIAGGPVIGLMSAVLIALGGLALRWLRPEWVLPQQVLRRLDPGRPQGASDEGSAPGLLDREPAAPPVHPQPGKGLVEPLSGRELEVLRLIEQGLSNQEIADKLVVATSTVKTHINNIYGKLGVQTRVQALKRAKELGLLL